MFVIVGFVWKLILSPVGGHPGLFDQEELLLEPDAQLDSSFIAEELERQLQVVASHWSDDGPARPTPVQKPRPLRSSRVTAADRANSVGWLVR